MNSQRECKMCKYKYKNCIVSYLASRPPKKDRKVFICYVL